MIYKAEAKYVQLFDSTITSSTMGNIRQTQTLKGFLQGSVGFRVDTTVRNSGKDITSLISKKKSTSPRGQMGERCPRHAGQE